LLGGLLSGLADGGDPKAGDVAVLDDERDLDGAHERLGDRDGEAEQADPAAAENAALLASLLASLAAGGGCGRVGDSADRLVAGNVGAVAVVVGAFVLAAAEFRVGAALALAVGVRVVAGAAVGGASQLVAVAVAVAAVVVVVFFFFAEVGKELGDLFVEGLIEFVGRGFVVLLEAVGGFVGVDAVAVFVAGAGVGAWFGVRSVGLWSVGALLVVAARGVDVAAAVAVAGALRIGLGVGVHFAVEPSPACSSGSAWPSASEP
jgi:hypothetical protein